MAKEKRLARGLEALLGRIGGAEQTTFDLEKTGIPVDADGTPPSAAKTAVEMTLIDRNPFQPRRQFDEAELDQLAASLQTHGLLQPILVRQVGERFQIVAGERRFRAALRAGWSEIAVVVRNVTDREMMELALVENVQRTDLNDIEKATAFARYLEMYGGTQDELAKRLEMGRSTVTNLLRLLNAPPTLQELVQNGTLEGGHARALLPLEEQAQLEVAARIQKEKWSTRDTEAFVRDLVNTGATIDKNWNVVDKTGVTRPVETKSEQIRKLEEDFRLHLGMKVRLSQTDKSGKGKLVISFANHADFERLRQAICRPEKKLAR